MIHTLKKAAYKHGYLIITAAWLYTISFIFINYWSYTSSPKKVKSRIEQQLVQQEISFNKLLADSVKLNSLMQEMPDVSGPIPEDIGLFVYYYDQTKQFPVLHYWNTNRIYVKAEDLSRKEGGFFVENQNGHFECIVRKISRSNREWLVIGMLPIRWSYFMENKYLHTEFSVNPDIHEQYEISTDADALAVNSSRGEELFKIKLRPGKSFIAYDFVTLLLRILSVIFLLIFLHSVSLELKNRYRFKTGFVFLITLVIL
ncbi:MAG: hypothetical protein RLZZ28_2622, partial [Bacteroidota bacterium]